MPRLLDLAALGPITVLQEAEGEPYSGKVAVSEVIHRRMVMKYRSDGTVEGTVLRPLQFSGWNATASNRLRTIRADDQDLIVRDCMKAWDEGATSSLVPAALFYYSTDIPAPAWAAEMDFVNQIGKHRFYAPK